MFSKPQNYAAPTAAQTEHSGERVALIHDSSNPAMFRQGKIAGLAS